METLKPVNTSRLLRELGYSFEHYVEPRVEPERVDTRFEDIIPELAKTRLKGLQLYRHQAVAYQALSQGKNIILRSGTGSGKTEAWALHALQIARKGCKTLALYPTLALANDQVKRLKEYTEAVGIKLLQLDAPRREELEAEHGRAGLRRLVGEADIVVSNPAFILHDVKKLVVSPSRSLLEPVYRRLCLLVVDELDFYGPRGVALLLALIEFFTSYGEMGLQVAALTATLANPEDLAEYLTKVTGRETIIVDGRPFHPENHVYIVLGKRVEELRKKILETVDASKLPREIASWILDEKEFMRNVYRVVEALRALGYDIPSPGTDPVEILQHYLNDPGVTIVFTKSIASAEQLYRRLRERLGEKAELVAVHHHLVPKKAREEVEEKARRGLVKIIVSPRTLLQGIDIGTVVRIVHYGLPEDVREFLQREGRKGRRPNIAYTESVILPVSRWDRELLAKGVEALRKWLNLPLEKTIVNPDNMYRSLFTGLAKLLSPWLSRAGLTQDEKKALEAVGVLTAKGPRMEEAKRIWERINFYEYGPPYGIKRYLVHGDGREEALEPIGYCDLVEKFQVGCIDYSSDAIVVGLKRGRTSRLVTAVVEKPLREFRPWEIDAIAEAFEDYRETKIRWGEEPNLLKDIMRGKLVTEVLTVVYPPRNGFGLLRKIPNRVVWMLYSDRPRLVKGPRGLEVVYDRRLIYVPVNTAGEYRDFTYGFTVEASERDSPTLLRLGLAYIMTLLRRHMGYDIETFKYGIGKIGDKKFIEIHEPEATGLLPKMDWASLRKLVETHEPDELDEILLMQVDELAYAELIALDNPWETVKTAALRVIDLLSTLTRLKAVLGDKTVAIPKPSRGLKIVALDIVAERLEATSEVLPEVLVAAAAFDGETEEAIATVYRKLPFTKPPRDLLAFETSIEDMIYYEEFRLVVYDRETVVRAASEAGMKKLAQLLEEAVEVKQLLPQIGVEENTPLEALLEALRIEGWEKPRIQPTLQDAVAMMAGQQRPGPKTLETIRRHMASRAKALYIAHLALSELAKTVEKHGER